MWRLHQHELYSAQKVLGAHVDGGGASSYSVHVFEVGLIRALAFYVHGALVQLVRAKEFAMDATYGTNSCGMELFVVLAELYGTDIPLAYMFICKNSNREEGVVNNEGDMAVTLFQIPPTIERQRSQSDFLRL